MCAVVDGIRYLGVGRCLYLGFKPSRSLTDNQYQIHFEKRPTIPFLFTFFRISLLQRSGNVYKNVILKLLTTRVCLKKCIITTLQGTDGITITKFPVYPLFLQAKNYFYTAHTVYCNLPLDLLQPEDVSVSVDTVCTRGEWASSCSGSAWWLRKYCYTLFSDTSTHTIKHLLPLLHRHFS